MLSSTEWTRCVVCVSRGPMTDLGSSALTLVGIMEYQRQTGYRQYQDLGRQLANFLLYMQKKDGEFCHRYDVEEGHKLCKQKLLYYSGEAALGLALAYDQLRDERYKLVRHIAGPDELYDLQGRRFDEGGNLAGWELTPEAEDALERMRGELDTLLDEMSPAAISLVAEAGEVMPQKSTYFNPKAPTGLVLNPLEP